ncbi:LysR family transcriptional regulator [bacterium]|nr:LysR family transcriptional regulator [bacterium]
MNKAAPITSLSWELSILSQAVSFSNLSAASQQIGLSQPQLSRILAKLEKGLGLVLLNREVKRRATWTPIAHELAQTFSRGSRHLEAEILRLIEDSPIRQIRMATLEGLLGIAAEIGQRMMVRMELETLELDVLDLNELEERFLRGDLDLILTMREPGRRKYSFSKIIGYQSLDEIERTPKGLRTRLQSAYEHQSEGARKKQQKSEITPTLISNSLSLRRHWLDHYGGSGLFPSPLQQRNQATKSETPVILLGSESLGSRAWKSITS